MQKCNAFAFGAQAGNVVYQLDACPATPFEGAGQIIDSKADVMDSGTAFRDELADGTAWGFGLQQLDERVTSA